MGRLLVLVVAICGTFAVNASVARSLPPCSPTHCHSSGAWFWNKSAAEYQLLTLGIDVGGRHYQVRNASCYGIGKHMWSEKGPEFQKFHCGVNLFDADGNVYPPYGLTLYVQGHYAWTWGR